MTERLRTERKKDNVTAPEAFFAIEDGIGAIHFEVEDNYPIATPEDTYARSMTAFTPIPEERKADVRGSIDVLAGGNVVLGQILRTEYAAGVATSSTKNITHFTDVLRRMADDSGYLDAVLHALETNTELRESLYRAQRGEASPEQKIQLLQELPYLEASEISRRSFSLDPDIAMTDEAMLEEVRLAMLLRGGEIYDPPQQVRLPKLRAVEALYMENIHQPGAVIFTTKYDLGKLTMPSSKNDIIVRLRQKHFAMIDDWTVQDGIRQTRKKLGDSFSVHLGLLELQKTEEFIQYCQELLGRPDTHCLSSIVYGFSQGVDKYKGLSLSAFKDAVRAIVQEAEQYTSRQSRAQQVISPHDIVDAKERIEEYISNLEVAPVGGMAEIYRNAESDPVLQEVIGAAYVRTHQRIK